MLFIHEYVKLTNTGLLLYIISFSTHWQISSFLCIKALHWWFSIFVHSLYRLIRWTIGESLYMLIKLWRHQLKTPHLITQNSYIIPQFTLQTNNPESQDIRGISSLTTDYAVVRYCGQNAEGSEEKIRKLSSTPHGEEIYQVPHKEAAEAKQAQIWM